MRYLFNIFFVLLFTLGLGVASEVDPRLARKGAYPSLVHLNLKEMPPITDIFLNIMKERKEMHQVENIFQQTEAYTFVFTNPSKRKGLVLTHCKKGTDLEKYLSLFELKFKEKGEVLGLKIFEFQGIYVTTVEKYSLIISSFHPKKQNEFVKECNAILEQFEAPQYDKNGSEQAVLFDFFLDNKYFKGMTHSRFAHQMLESLERMRIDVMNEQKQMYLKINFQFSEKNNIDELLQMVTGFKTMASSFLTMSQGDGRGLDKIVPLLNSVQFKRVGDEMVFELSHEDLLKTMPPVLYTAESQVRRNKRGMIPKEAMDTMLSSFAALKKFFPLDKAVEEQLKKEEVKGLELKIEKIKRKLKALEEKTEGKNGRFKRREDQLNRRLEEAVNRLQELKSES